MMLGNFELFSLILMGAYMTPLSVHIVCNAHVSFERNRFVHSFVHTSLHKGLKF